MEKFWVSKIISVLITSTTTLFTSAARRPLLQLLINRLISSLHNTHKKKKELRIDADSLWLIK